MRAYDWRSWSCTKTVLLRSSSSSYMRRVTKALYLSLFCLLLFVTFTDDHVHSISWWPREWHEPRFWLYFWHARVLQPRWTPWHVFYSYGRSTSVIWTRPSAQALRFTPLFSTQIVLSHITSHYSLYSALSPDITRLDVKEHIAKGHRGSIVAPSRLHWHQWYCLRVAFNFFIRPKGRQYPARRLRPVAQGIHNMICLYSSLIFNTSLQLSWTYRTDLVLYIVRKLLNSYLLDRCPSRC